SGSKEAFQRCLVQLQSSISSRNNIPARRSTSTGKGCSNCAFRDILPHPASICASRGRTDRARLPRNGQTGRQQKNGGNRRSRERNHDGVPSMENLTDLASEKASFSP